MSSRRAPYANRKRKEPEYEEPPTIVARVAEEQEPPREKVVGEPLRGGLVQEEKTLPVAHLGEVHDYYDLFKPKTPIKEKPVIRGRSVSVEPPKSKTPPAEGTRAAVTNQKTVTPTQWANVVAEEKQTHYKLMPKDKEDGAHQA